MPAGTNYGPFAEVVFYVTTGIAAALAVAVAALGPLWRLRSPEEDMPKVAQAGTAAACFVAMTGLFLFAEPSAAVLLFAIAAGSAVVWLLTFVPYSGTIGEHKFPVEYPRKWRKGVTTKYIIGGDEILPEAAAEMKARKQTVGEYLFDCGNNPDRVWSRLARRRVKSRLLRFFFLVMLSGTVAAAAAGFALWMTISGKPAAPFMHQSSSPYAGTPGSAPQTTPSSRP